MKKKIFCRYSALTTVIVFVVGCAATDRRVAQDQQIQEAMAQANATAKNGEYDKALQMLDKIAKDSPTSKDPWLRTAQLQFDKGNYGQAIVAAQEVVQRDSSDNVAKSILAVAGLRISTRALGELRDENGLSGTTRSEAQALTTMLREALGETTLVPPVISAPSGNEQASASPPKPQSRANAGTASVRKPSSSSATDSSITSKPKASGNPFGALR